MHISVECVKKAVPIHEGRVAVKQTVQEEWKIGT